MNDAPENDRLEILLTRRLDGCMQPGDDAELDRHLESSEQAREIWRQTAAVDALAADALTWAGSRATTPKTIPFPRVRANRLLRPVALLRFGAAGALAASIAFSAIQGWVGSPNGPTLPTSGRIVAPNAFVRPVSFPVEIAPAEVMEDLTNPYHRHRRTDSGRIGIIRGDQVYLMSVDHDRVAAVPVRAEL